MELAGSLESIPERTSPRRATGILLWTIAGFFVLFVVWAALAQIDRTTRGQGRVVASSRLQVITNLEGGVLKEILVHNGDVVKAGQALVRLDPTASGAELGSGEASVMALRAKIARLKAEVLGREPVYLDGAVTGALEFIAIERALHSARMAELAGQENAAQARARAASQGIGEADANLAARRSAARSASLQLETTRELVEKRLEPRISLEQAEGSSGVARSEVQAAIATAGRARAGVAEAQAGILQARSDWQARAANELSAAQAELAARERTIPALAARMNRTTLRAPLEGRVNRVLVTTIGSAVAAGSPIAEIAPSQDTLVIEAMVRPHDIARVHPGQSAKVNISAYDPALYGSLEGVVETVSPDAVFQEDARESFYIVRVRTKASTMRDRNGAALPIVAGMTADVALLGEKRSILSYLLTPITRLSENAFRE